MRRTILSAVAVAAFALAASAAVGPPLLMPAAGPNVPSGDVALTPRGDGWAAVWHVQKGRFGRTDLASNGHATASDVIGTVEYGEWPSIASNGDIDVVSSPIRTIEVYRGSAHLASHELGGRYRARVASDGEIFLVVASRDPAVEALFLDRNGSAIGTWFPITPHENGQLAVASNGTSFIVLEEHTTTVDAYVVSRGGVVVRGGSVPTTFVRLNSLHAVWDGTSYYVGWAAMDDSVLARFNSNGYALAAQRIAGAFVNVAAMRDGVVAFLNSADGPVFVRAGEVRRLAVPFSLIEDVACTPDRCLVASAFLLDAVITDLDRPAGEPLAFATEPARLHDPSVGVGDTVVFAAVNDNGGFTPGVHVFRWRGEWLPGEVAVPAYLHAFGASGDTAALLTNTGGGEFDVTFIRADGMVSGPLRVVAEYRGPKDSFAPVQVVPFGDSFVLIWAVTRSLGSVGQVNAPQETFTRYAVVDRSGKPTAPATLPYSSFRLSTDNVFVGVGKDGVYVGRFGHAPSLRLGAPDANPDHFDVPLAIASDGAGRSFVLWTGVGRSGTLSIIDDTTMTVVQTIRHDWIWPHIVSDGKAFVIADGGTVTNVDHDGKTLEVRASVRGIQDLAAAHGVVVAATFEYNNTPADPFRTAVRFIAPERNRVVRH